LSRSFFDRKQIFGDIANIVLGRETLLSYPRFHTLVFYLPYFEEIKEDKNKYLSEMEKLGILYMEQTTDDQWIVRVNKVLLDEFINS